MSTEIANPRLPMYRGATPPGPEDLAAFVRALYAFFYTCRSNKLHRQPWRHSPQWDGGVYKGRRYNAVWPKLVAFLRENRLPIVEYMFRAVFEHSLYQVPLPNQLMSQSMLAAFREYEADFRRRCDRCRIQLRCYSANAESKIVDEIQMVEITGRPVTRRELQIAALLELKEEVMAYVVAFDCGLLDVLDRLQRGEEYAELKYSAMPAVYDYVFGDLLPNDFTARARKRYLVGLFDDESVRAEASHK